MGDYFLINLVVRRCEKMNRTFKAEVSDTTMSIKKQMPVNKSSSQLNAFLSFNYPMFYGIQYKAGGGFGSGFHF